MINSCLEVLLVLIHLQGLFKYLKRTFSQWIPLILVQKEIVFLTLQFLKREQFLEYCLDRSPLDLL